MRVLGIIPARAGSKGIPAKNLRLLAGKPLLQYTAEAALAARALSDVILSTDDDQIAAVGRSCGLSVPFIRPRELGADDTPMLPVVVHALEQLQANRIEYDAVCLLQPTSPMRTAQDIDSCIALFIDNDADCVFTVLPVPERYNPDWTYFLDSRGYLRRAAGSGEPVGRRQDLPPALHREGSIYVSRVSVITKQQSLYGEKVLPYPIDPQRSVNLDTEADWERAEQLLRTQRISRPIIETSRAPHRSSAPRRGIKVGIVGCGSMGKKHLQVLSNLDEYDVVTVCDTSGSRLKELSSQLPGEIVLFDSPRKMLEETHLDLLVVSTPPLNRREVVVEALKRHIAVLSEKPLAIDLETADEIVKVAQETGTFLAVHHQNRVSPALHRCLELMNSGLIGNVRILHGRGKSGRPGSVELMEIGVHLADMMTILAGQPQWCSANLVDGHRLATAAGVRQSRELSPLDPDMGPAVGTLVSADFGFDGGVLGEMHFYGHEKGMPENLGITVVGTRGQLALHCSRHVKRQLWHLPRPMQGTPEQCRDWKEVQVSTGNDEDLVVAYYLELARALEGDSTRICTGQGGQKALEMVLALYRSHRAGGRRIALPLANRRHPLKGWTE